MKKEKNNKSNLPPEIILMSIFNLLENHNLNKSKYHANIFSQELELINKNLVNIMLELSNQNVKSSNIYLEFKVHHKRLNSAVLKFNNIVNRLNKKYAKFPILDELILSIQINLKLLNTLISLTKTEYEYSSSQIFLTERGKVYYEIYKELKEKELQLGNQNIKKIAIVWRVIQRMTHDGRFRNNGYLKKLQNKTKNDFSEICYYVDKAYSMCWKRINDHV